MLLAALLGWVAREQRDVIVFLREENRALKAQLSDWSLRLNDDQDRKNVQRVRRSYRTLRARVIWSPLSCAGGMAQCQLSLCPCRYSSS